MCTSSFFFHIISLFFFNDTPPTEIYTLSLHDALPIFLAIGFLALVQFQPLPRLLALLAGEEDRKSTRLNSSHQIISYAVFCLKKKNINKITMQLTLTMAHPS